jgi:hypothetical protein
MKIIVYEMILPFCRLVACRPIQCGRVKRGSIEYHASKWAQGACSVPTFCTNSGLNYMRKPFFQYVIIDHFTHVKIWAHFRTFDNWINSLLWFKICTLLGQISLGWHFTATSISCGLSELGHSNQTKPNQTKPNQTRHLLFRIVRAERSQYRRC